MKFVFQIVEQLSEAIKHLGKQTPTGNRLALILVDNFLEIMMYKFIKSEFFKDNLPEFGKTPKYSRRKKKKVMANFNEKVKLLWDDLNILSEDEYLVILYCHKARNETYHESRLREDILGPLTKTYFATSRNIAVKLWPRSFTESRECTWLHDFVETYLDGREERGFDGGTALKGLPVIGSDNDKELKKSLRNNLINRIDNLNEGLTYLADEQTRDLGFDVLTRLQYWDTDPMRNASEGFTWERIKAELNAFRPRITGSTIIKWRDSSEALSNNDSAGYSLKSFFDIDRELGIIENLVEEALFLVSQKEDELMQIEREKDYEEGI